LYKEFIVSETLEKSLYRSGLFESITDYRQRTGKAKEDLNADDYVPVIINALKAAGFEVVYAVAPCTYICGEQPGETVRKGGTYSYEVTVRVIPGGVQK
jgi:hypothetical protein